MNPIANLRALLRLSTPAIPTVPTRIDRAFRRRLIVGAWFSVGLIALLPWPGHAQGALTNGGNQDGTLATGATNSYTVTAGAGDRIVLQLAKLSGGAGFTPVLELFAPDGTRLESSSDAVAARVDLQAPAPGNYGVTVRDANRTGSGNYRLRLAQVPGNFTIPAADEGGALTNGTVHLGTNDLGDLDLWTISASRGDRIAVQIAELSGGAGFTPMLELFKPDGTRVGFNSGGVATRLDAQADLSGLYTVLVSDLNRTGVGSYQLQVAQIPGSFVVPAGDEGGTLPDGIDTDGAIPVGDLDRWTFTANPGDRVTLQVTKLTGGAGFTPLMELFDPKGERKGVAQNASLGTIDVAIELGGTYTLLVSDLSQTGTGTYRLHLTRGAIAPPGPNVLVNGGSSLASISAAGETNRWTFAASAGESIVVRMGETATSGLVPWLRLFGPDGVLVDQQFSPVAAEVSVRATNTGTFLVVVADGSGGRNQTGNYRLSLAKTGSPLAIPATDEGGSLTNGASYLGAIDTGDIDAWTITANIGDSIVVRMGETTAGSSLLPWLRLYGPNGVLLGSDFNATAAEVTTRATNSGTFLVVVGDGNNGFGGTGNYRLSLAKTGNPAEISSSDEGGSLVNGTTYLAAIDNGDIDAWTFTANAGESMVVRMGETTAGSSLLPWLRLYGPNGVLLSSDFNATAAEVTARATNSGTFLVVAGDGNSAFGGIGNYRISLAKTGSPLEISPSDEGGQLVNGTTYLGTIDTGDIDAWTFTANTGDSLVVRAGETTAGSSLLPWLRLYGPNGVLLDSGFNAASAEVTIRATNSGAFLVVVGDGVNGLSGTGNYRISLAKTGSPLDISPSDEGGPLANGTTYLGTIDTGDIDGWTFTANTGESIIVRMGETTTGSGLLPWLRLYGPNGVPIDANFNATTAEVTTRATNSGTFLVVAGDGTSGLGGSGNYRISLAKTGSPISASAGDEGGPMSGAGIYDGTIDTGDLDAWTFTACAGDLISLNVTELVSGSTLTPWIRLYGRDGVLLKTVFGAGTAGITKFVAPASGAYLVVITDGTSAFSGTGTYRLTVNGLTDALKLCVPLIAGSTATIGAVGGAAGAPFIVLTATNITTPLELWSPIRTNQFDQFGAMSITTQFNRAEPQRFFYLQTR